VRQEEFGREKRRGHEKYTCDSQKHKKLPNFFVNQYFSTKFRTRTKNLIADMESQD